MIASQMSKAEALALPVSIDLTTAGRALGLGRTKSYELARRGEFPLPTIPVGNDKYRVTRAALLMALGIADEPSARPAA